MTVAMYVNTKSYFYLFPLWDLSNIWTPAITAATLTRTIEHYKKR